MFKVGDIVTFRDIHVAFKESPRGKIVIIDTRSDDNPHKYGVVWNHIKERNAIYWNREQDIAPYCEANDVLKALVQ